MSTSRWQSTAGGSVWAIDLLFPGAPHRDDPHRVPTMSTDGGPVVVANLSDHQKPRLVIGFCRGFQHPRIFPKHLGFVEVDAMLGLVRGAFGWTVLK